MRFRHARETRDRIDVTKFLRQLAYRSSGDCRRLPRLCGSQCFIIDTFFRARRESTAMRFRARARARLGNARLSRDVFNRAANNPRQ